MGEVLLWMVLLFVAYCLYWVLLVPPGECYHCGERFARKRGWVRIEGKKAFCSDQCYQDYMWGPKWQDWVE